MALGWKIVIDSADPHRQAAFWAAALEYVVEDNSPLIERLLGYGAIDAAMYVEIDGQKFWRDAAAVRHPEDPYDAESGTGLGRRLLFNRVPEPKSGKNRLHIDVHALGQDRAAAVARLEALGATVRRRVNEQGGAWTVMSDPEDNEFCVITG
jgi:hypothetical protein